MPSVTKYFHVTNQIMVSYTYDKSIIIDASTSTSSDAAQPLSYYQPVLYRSMDNTVGMLTTRFEKNKPNQTNNIFYTKFEDRTNSTQTYLGYRTKDSISSNQSSANSITSITKYYMESLVRTNRVKEIIYADEYSNNMFFGSSSNLASSSWLLPYDKLKVYFIAGYTMNDMAALCIKVSAKTNDLAVTSTKNNRNSTTLANIVILKENLKNNIQWLSNPMYMNSRFYDRYIEIDIPGIYALAKGFTDASGENPRITDPTLVKFLKTLNISPSTVLTLQFSNVLDEEMSRVNNGNILKVKDNSLYGTCQFVLHSSEEGNMKLDSNDEYFNVRIFEDTTTKAVVYYPIFGKGNAYSDLNLDIMYNIESGRISMEDLSVRDANMTGEEFIDAYGEGALKWVILNEVNTQYNYIKINVGNETLSNATKTFVESKTSFIDYGGMSSTDGDFWRTYYKPMIPHFYGYVCDSIIVTVICHLYNRMTGADITRTASIVIDDVNAKYNSNPKMIDVSNISKWKIVNRLGNKDNIQIRETQKPESTKEYVRAFYDSTNLLLKDPENDNVYSQGEATLKLYHETHNYTFKLYNMDANNAQVPYVMSGNYNYYLVLPSVDGVKIKIHPLMVDGATNLSLGTLMYRITESDVKNVMALPENDRYFAIICEGSKNTDRENSTIYEGKVDYYTNV